MTTRRDCLALAATAWALSPRLIAAQQTGPLITRPIPSSGERLPIIGLGSSATFSQAAGRDDTGAVRGVLAKMIELGGRVFDTAPGYGASEQLAGQIAEQSVAQAVDAFEMFEEQDQPLEMRGGELAVNAVERMRDGMRNVLLL